MEKVNYAPGSFSKPDKKYKNKTLKMTDHLLSKTVDYKQVKEKSKKEGAKIKKKMKTPRASLYDVRTPGRDYQKVFKAASFSIKDPKHIRQFANNFLTRKALKTSEMRSNMYVND